MACPAPFLAPGDFPSNQGYVPGRFCGTITSDLACCLPCPTQDWIYSDNFERNIRIGTWLNIPSLICQVFLLVTFAIWPKEISHRHYLSIGLCISLILGHLAFIVPLGTKPDICANELTPKDMYSSQSCAWSGALLEAGAMGTAVWVMLRSLWVHLQVCWDVDILKKRAGFWAAQAIGWGLPGLFLAVSFPISGVSYRVGPTCFPNTYKSFITWFGWLIAFGCLATAIQFATTVFCLWIYLRDIVGGDSATTTKSSGNGSRNSAYIEEPAIKSGFDADDSARGKLAWDRVKKVVKSQWRSMVLCIGLSVFSIYFGAIFVSQARTGEKAASGESRDALVRWAFCLITNNGDKSQCGGVGKQIGLNENMVVAIWPLAGLLGLLTFLLMLRGSMLTGWWRLIRYQRLHPRIAEHNHTRRDRAEKPREGSNFVLPQESTTTKRKSYGIRLESERPGMVSPTDSEYTRAPESPVSPIGPPAWPMSPPQQTSTQRISNYGGYPPPAGSAPSAGYAPREGHDVMAGYASMAGQNPSRRQIPTDGFDSSSDDDDEILPVHERRNENHMV